MVDAGVGGLTEESAILVHALREIDVENLPEFLGVMPAAVMAKIDDVLKEVLRLK
jgi:mRNA-degrading endonuclease toxin of MazEF toxin-antitoxin module